MNQKNFKAIGSSVLSTKDNTRRKEILVKPLQCWVNDYEKEIAVEPTGRYYLRHDSKNKLMTSEHFARYKIYVPLRSNTEVIVELRCKIVAGMDPFDNFKRMPIEEALKVKAVVEKGVSDWNNHFKLQIVDPKCGTRTLPIKYVVVWSENDYHYEINVVRSARRESVSEGSMNITSDTNEATITHEYAHCIGIPDEYTDEYDPIYISYVKPDGTLEARIKAVRGGKAEDEPDASFMGSFNRQFFDYHAWNIAIEVQELLRDQLQRKIVCDIPSA